MAYIGQPQNNTKNSLDELAITVEELPFDLPIDIRQKLRGAGVVVGLPWCQSFVYYCMSANGLSEFKTAHANTYYNNLKKKYGGILISKSAKSVVKCVILILFYYIYLLCITLFFNISFKYLVKKYSILC